MAQDRTGVLILRVWSDETDGRLRARITHVLDITTREERVVVVGSVEEIEKVVHEWLVEFAPSSDTAVTDQ